MGSPIAFAQIDTAPEAIGRPVLAILGDRGLEFRRVPLPPGRFFGLLLTLVVLAIFMASLVIVIVGETSRSGSSLSAYLVAIVVALIAWAVALLSNRDLKILATDQWITAGKRTIKWTDIKTVRRRNLFESSIVSRTGEAISISSWLDGEQLLLDLCEYAVERRSSLEECRGSMVESIASRIRGRGAEFEFSYSAIAPLGWIMLRHLTIFVFFSYVAYSASHRSGQIVIGMGAVIQAIQAGLYSYAFFTAFSARFDRIAIGFDGVRRLRNGEIASGLAWTEVSRELGLSHRLRFPIRSKDGKVTMTSPGLGQSKLLDAVLEYACAISVREN